MKYLLLILPIIVSAQTYVGIHGGGNEQILVINATVRHDIGRFGLMVDYVVEHQTESFAALVTAIPFKQNQLSPIFGFGSGFNGEPAALVGTVIRLTPLAKGQLAYKKINGSQYFILGLNLRMKLSRKYKSIF